MPWYHATDILLGCAHFLINLVFVKIFLKLSFKYDALLRQQVSNKFFRIERLEIVVLFTIGAVGTAVFKSKLIRRPTDSETIQWSYLREATWITQKDIHASTRLLLGADSTKRYFSIWYFELFSNIKDTR